MPPSIRRLGFVPSLYLPGGSHCGTLLPETQAEESTLPDYAAKVTERLAVASRIVRENLKNARRPLASGIIRNQNHGPFPRGI